MPSDNVLIWSFEHDAWWAPNECGYTKLRKGAGLYDRGRAEEICARANQYLPDDSPHEEIRETDAEAPCVCGHRLADHYHQPGAGCEPCHECDCDDFRDPEETE